jgi:hypothetical protein
VRFLMPSTIRRLASIGISIGISCRKWPGKAAVLRSPQDAKSFML